eukprot:Opistho-2@69871
MNTRRSSLTLPHAHDKKGVVALDYLPGSPLLLSQGRDGAVKLWDLQGSLSEPVSTLPMECITFCKMSPMHGGADDASGSHLLATPCSDAEKIDIWDTRTKTPCMSYRAPDTLDKSALGMCMSIALFRPDASPDLMLAVGHEGGGVIVHNLSANKTQLWARSGTDPILCLTLDSTRRSICYGSAAENVCCLDVGTPLGVPMQDAVPINVGSSLRSVTLPKHGVADIKIRADDRIIATGGWDSCIRLFGLRTLKPLAALKAHDATVNCVAFSSPHATEGGPSKVLLAGGSKDTKISIWDVYNAQ